MNRSSVITFMLELMVFVLCVFAFRQIWGLGSESRIFLYMIFAFCWLYRYQRANLMLEYYTHVITVFVYFLIISCSFAILLQHLHIFLVSLSSGMAWFLVISLARFLVLKFYKKPYEVIVHKVHAPLLTFNKKIKIVAKSQVEPGDLKRFSALVIDRSYAYGEDWDNLILHAAEHDIAIMTIGEYEEKSTQRLPLSKLKENWMYAGFAIPMWYRWLKHGIEFCFALLLMPFLIIVCGIVVFIILITMGRPIFYNQYRMGYNNKPFKVYKFRSMVKGADKEGETMHGDHRVTRFGAFMRKFRIDELPQFFNILKGDMSLIGPRPEWIKTARRFEKDIPLYRLRHIVKPGLTGWAQVNQGHTAGVDGNNEKLQYDLYYVKHYSLVLDIKIIIKTLYTIFTGFGAK